MVVACGAGHGTYQGANSLVDGWAIGEATPCAAGDAACQARVDVATAALAARDPNHAAIVSAVLHAEGLYPNEDGDLGQLFRSGGFPDVVLFELADGSHRAIGVRDEPIGGNKTQPHAYGHGPERREGHTYRGEPAATP